MANKSPEILSSLPTPEEVLENVNHLPVSMLREVIRDSLREHQNFVLVGETGSGKTTCLPLLLLELRNELKLKGGIAVTQPRRVATRSVTARVADMMGTEVGERVGYNIRFEDFTQDSTDITFMTDGILLRKIQFDPLLLEYSIVMIDEAHERSLNIDLCLGLIKDVNQRRYDAGLDPVHVVVSSATIERNKFSQFIGDGKVNNSLEIPGKMYPVQVFYENEIPWGYDYTAGAADRVKKIIKGNIPGDILIFMPGKKEIGLTIEKINELIGENTAEIIPLHSELPPEEQDRIFQPSKKRKIIVSTNIAETSVTIDGIIHVIDSGLIKHTQFNPRSGIEQLVLVEHALSGLEQRKGRAGRTAPGFCYRLFPEDSMKRRPPYPSPEIQRSNLGQLVLAMKKIGIEEVTDFDFIDRPNISAVRQAENDLHLLGALDDRGDLTEIGEIMVEFGLEPRLGRMLIEATKPQVDCVNEICIIASLLEGKNIFVRPTDIDLIRDADRHQHQFQKDAVSDFAVLLNVWNAYVKSGYDANWCQRNYLNEKSLEEAKNLRLELLDVLSNHGIEIDPDARPSFRWDAIGRAITSGLIGNLMQTSGRFLRKIDGTKNDIGVHPGSIFSDHTFNRDALIISDEIFINPQGKAYATNCLQIRKEWLADLAPDIYKQFKDHGHHSRKLFDRHSRNRR